MKITVNRRAFQELLKKARKFVGHKPSIPILSHVLLHGHKKGATIEEKRLLQPFPVKGQLTVTATDLESYFQSSINAFVFEEGPAVLPISPLIKIFDSSGGEPFLQIQTEPGRPECTAVSSLSGVSYTLDGCSLNDFPPIPSPPQGDNRKSILTIESILLRKIIERGMPFTDRNTGRYTLNSFLFRGTKNGMDVITVDGHRLFLQRINTPMEGTLLLPRNFLEKALPCLPRENKKHAEGLLSEEQIEIVSNGTRAFFTLPGTILSSKISSEQFFPEYENLLEKGSPILSVKMERKRLIQAIQQISKIETSFVEFCLDGGPATTITTENTKVGKATVSIPIVQEGPPFPPVCYDFTYLLEGLNVLETEEVVFQIKNLESPVIIEGVGDKNLVYVLMPIHRKK